MELSSLLGYGAAEASLALMWRLGILDMLLPQHALYLKVGWEAAAWRAWSRDGSQLQPATSLLPLWHTARRCCKFSATLLSTRCQCSL